ncbi:MAG: twin-arginine translocation pathway signal protein [Deltaproteobacteria bacterium]|nr:twin-arginine translocation pathway signal protein [Deltaproteobacteria bacterium]
MKAHGKGIIKGSMQQVLQVGITMLMAVILLTLPRIALAATAKSIDRDVDSSLQTLYQATPAAKDLSKIAKGILVFPSIIKGGLIVGGQYGEGALRVGGKTTGYYNTVSASYGLQAGAQSFGYALFFLDQEKLNYLKKSEGWEIGVDPNLVIVDEGLARSLSTTTAKSGIYAFFFNQKGLMAGLTIQGSKITKITPGK